MFKSLADLNILATALEQFVDNHCEAEIERNGESAELVRAREMLGEVDAERLALMGLAAWCPQDQQESGATGATQPADGPRALDRTAARALVSRFRKTDLVAILLAVPQQVRPAGLHRADKADLQDALARALQRPDVQADVLAFVEARDRALDRPRFLAAGLGSTDVHG